MQLPLPGSLAQTPMLDITSADWSGYPILRFPAVPASMEVHIMDRPALPFLGTGEAGQGPTAAAIAAGHRRPAARSAAVAGPGEDGDRRVEPVPRGHVIKVVEPSVPASNGK